MINKKINMNRNGFTLAEMLTVIVIMTLVILISLPSLKTLFEKNNKEKYASYEKMMIEYAKASNIKDNTTIPLDELGDLKKNMDSECTGYVTITNGAYKAHLTCGNKYSSDE